MNKEITKRIDFLPVFVICFCLGICLGKLWRMSFLFFYIAAWLTAIFSLIFLRQSKSTLFLLLLGILLGGISFKNSQKLANHHIFWFSPYKARALFIQGLVDDDPVYKTNYSQFILKAQRLKSNRTWHKVSGKILVKVFSKERFDYGEELIIEGKLYRPLGLKFGEGFDYRSYLENKNIYSILSVAQGRAIKRLGTAKNNYLLYQLIKLRQGLKNRFDLNLSGLAASIMNALILGERHCLSEPVEKVLKDSGTVHIIAISGLHVGIVAFMALLILKLLRLPRRMRYFIVIFLLLIYCILTGARVPVLRATLMAIVVLAGFILRREVNIYNSLSVAALIILIINPKQIFDVSFQLSFASVISIVFISPKIIKLYPGIFKKVKYLNYLLNAFAVSLAAWLGIIALIAYYFRAITPVAVIANMAIVPFMTVIIATGFSLLLVSFSLPGLSFIFSAACEGAILILLTMVSFFAGLPLANFKTRAISPCAVLWYYILLISFFLSVSYIVNIKFMLKYKKSKGNE